MIAVSARMSKEPAQIYTREEWLAAAKKLFPHATPKQLDQPWEGCRKAGEARERFYERSANKTRFE